jgi:hypothetical protein
VGNGGEGTGCEWAQAVFAKQQSAGGEDPPPTQISTRDLTGGEGFDDFSAIVPRLLGFSNAATRFIVTDVHGHTPLMAAPPMADR